MKNININIDELFPDFDRPPKFKKTIHHLKGVKFIDLFAGIGGMRIPFDELEQNACFHQKLTNMPDKHIKLILMKRYQMTSAL